MLKKFILTVLSAFLIFMSFPASSAYALGNRSTWYTPDLQDWYTRVYGGSTPSSEVFGERYTAAQVDWIIWSLFTFIPRKVFGPAVTGCLISAVSGENVVTIITECIANLSVTSDAGSSPLYAFSQSEYHKNPSEKSIVQSILTENRPISGIGYVRDIGRKLNPTKPADAQGFGYSEALQPVREMWVYIRNTAYFLFVVAAVILAFMVMFRTKIAPQVVITAQSAIWKLASALLFVTFSYAIAGFLIDLMYVVYGILSMLLHQMAPYQTANGFFRLLTAGYVQLPRSAGGFDEFAMGALGLALVYLAIFPLAFFVVIATAVGPIITAFATIVLIALPIAGLFTPMAGLVAMITVIGIIIMVVILLIFVFKLLFLIVKTYVKVLLQTIFAPLIILLGVVSPMGGLSKWIRDYITNLMVFITISVLFAFALIFLDWAVISALTGYLEEAEIHTITGLLIGTSSATISDIIGAGNPGWPPLLIIGSGEGAAAFVFTLISLVSFFSIPKAAEVIQAALSGKPFAYGSAVGEGLAPAIMAGRAGGTFAAARGLDAATKVYGNTPTIQTIRKLLGFK